MLLGSAVLNIKLVAAYAKVALCLNLRACIFSLLRSFVCSLCFFVPLKYGIKKGHLLRPTTPIGMASKSQ